MFRYVRCPGCYTNLKFKGDRTSLSCPKCNTRITLATKSDSPFGVSKTQADVQENSASTGTKSHALVLGLAAGTVAASLIVAAILLIGDREPQPAQQESPPLASNSPPAEDHAFANSETSEDDKESQDQEIVSSPPSKPIQLTNASDPSDENTTPEDNSTDSSDSWFYQWKTGNKFSYQFEIEADVNGRKSTANGTCFYRVGEVAHEPTEKELSTTGTGFVVSTDGYLVTCAHVVHQAANIKVTLGETSWDAQVVAVDPIQDLAVVKIQAKGLPALAISDAKDVILAEPVRVVGFPLSNVLGKGIKITSGSVAGRTETAEDGAQSFQVDASVNPGNSGGPIVDEKGQVVGVASALLSGFRISEVGFAVPAKEVQLLLQKAGVKPSALSNPKKRSGPELANLVTPSVAYFEVQLDPKFYRSHWLEYDFSYQTSISSAPFADSSGLPTSGSILPIKGKGKFAVTRFGEVSQVEGDARLPYDLDPVGALIVENLQHEDKNKWSSTSYKELKIKQPDKPGIRHPRESLEDKEDSSDHLALEEFEYEITDKSADQVTISKKYDCKTLGDKDPPVYQQNGTGTIVFDRSLGMPKEMEFQTTVKLENGNNRNSPANISFQYQLSSVGDDTEDRLKSAIGSFARLMGAGVAKESEKYSRSPKSRRKKRATPKPRTSPHTSVVEHRRDDPQRVDELIKLLDPNNKEQELEIPEPDLSGIPEEHARLFREHRERMRSLHRPSRTAELIELASLAVVAKRQNKVGNLFLHYAAKGSTFDRNHAIDGLANWASKSHIAGMIRLLTQAESDFHWHERKQLIKILSQFKTPQVAKAIASRLMYFAESGEASEALIAIGSVAENAVAEILNHKSEDARGAAAEILKEIGTRKSLPSLKKAFAEEPDEFIRDDIHDAIEAIENR